MTDFERELANALERKFREELDVGVSYRLKQHEFSGQKIDVLAEIPHHDIGMLYGLGIECKSKKIKGTTSKLYFSDGFSTKDGVHQVENINDFLQNSGRTGFLAVELKRGRGKPRSAILIPWSVVRERYEGDANGIPLEDTDFPTFELERYKPEDLTRHLYRIPDEVYEEIISKRVTN